MIAHAEKTGEIQQAQQVSQEGEPQWHNLHKI
jgi:hypothetical protein